MPDTTRRFAGDDDAFAALILRFLDGATTEAEEATLNAELGDPENGSRRDLYVALCRQRGLLTEILPRAPKARSKVWGRVAVAAAVILAVIGIWLLFPFSKAEPVGVAVVERVEGRVVRSDGSAVAAGESLRAGQGLETNGRGRAVFRFDDGTRVTLEAETSLRGLAVRDGKVFRLDRGTIRAKVAKQARPMTVGTPEAEATILGTEFVLRTSKAATRLEVHAGRVQLTRLSDRASAEVAGGQYAVASAGEAPRARSRAAASVLELEPDRWISIPGTAMKSAAPDPARFPAIQGAMGVEAVVAAWSGGAFDTRRNRLVLWGGGHTDYHGNEVYAFSVESMSWERVTEPNPAPRLDFETNADGTPNCRATYNGLAYLVHADRLFSFGGSVAGNGFASCRSTLALDFDRRTWTSRAPSGDVPPPDLGSHCSYDPATRKVWWGGTKGLFSYDFDANRWTKHGDEAFYYHTSALDPKRGLWIVAGSNAFFAYDVRGAKPVRLDWKTTGGDALLAKSNPGLDYDPVRDRITGWAGGAVYTLDPVTKAWTAFSAPGGPAPAPTPNGTYGRWRYAPSVDAFILVASAGGDVHFYKPGK